MSSQYIFTMYKLSRTHPPDKQVLKDISLSFLPGAKIGVLGLNGSGKSTLLRIMAGRDKEFRGEAQLAPGASVGLLEQEPHLDDYKDAVVAVTHDRYFLDNVAGWILELDRGHGIPFRGNYSSWLEQKQARLQQEERRETARQRTIARELEWVRTNPKGRRTKSKARLANYERLLAEERNVRLDQVQIHIPAGQRLGGTAIEADDVRKGFADRLLIEDLSFDLPPAGIVGVIGPNG